MKLKGPVDENGTWETPPAGLVYREPGEVIVINTGGETGRRFVVTDVSLSCARCVPIERATHTFKARTFDGRPDKTVTIAASRDEVIRISPTRDRGPVETTNNLPTRKSTTPRTAPATTPPPRRSTTTTETNNMKTKNKTKSETPVKREGKMEFIKGLLLDGKHTKNQIAQAVVDKFEGSNFKSSRKTVDFTASVALPKEGKKSKHLPEPKATATAAPKRTGKPAAKPAKKSSTPPARPAKK
jgi:hypothetical protein